MDGVFFAVMALLFAAVFLALEGGWLWWSGRHGSASQRIARRLRLMSGEVERSERVCILKQRRFSTGPRMDSWLRRLPLTSRIDQLLVQAGAKWQVANIVSAALALAAGALVLVRAWHVPLPAAIALVAGAGAIPVFLLLRARARRLLKIEEQLPEAADFVARALRAGHSFTNVLHMAGAELPDPLAGEFRATHEEINYGVPMDDALHNLAARIPLTDLRYLVIAVLIQRESGGNLAEILGNISHIIRGRLQLMAQVRVLSAEGRMSAWVLGLLPFVVVATMLVVNPAYIRVLWTDPKGITLLWYGLGMLAVGVAWLRKLIHIRV
ncbi:MAG: type II secretion system F family protein [Pseudomonadota bacterium]